MHDERYIPSTRNVYLEKESIRELVEYKRKLQSVFVIDSSVSSSLSDQKRNRFFLVADDEKEASGNEEAGRL